MTVRFAVLVDSFVRVLEQIVWTEMRRRCDSAGRRGRADDFTMPGKRPGNFDADLEIDLPVPIDCDMPACPRHLRST